MEVSILETEPHGKPMLQPAPPPGRLLDPSRRFRCCCDVQLLLLNDSGGSFSGGKFFSKYPALARPGKTPIPRLTLLREPGNFHPMFGNIGQVVVLAVVVPGEAVRACRT